MDGFAFGTPQGDGDLREIVRLALLAYGGEESGIARWVENAGQSNLRVIREGAKPVASLVTVSMGQFFGGRSVPMVGIAGVAVAPEARGQGLARRLMQETLREAASAGTALSVLYATTQTLYRSVGYEQAGTYCSITLQLPQINLHEHAPAVVPLSDDDFAGVKACYQRFASKQEGLLDRGDYVWNRKRKSRDKVYQGFGVREGGGRIAGYVFLNQERGDSGMQTLTLSDFAFDTAPVGRRLLSFLHDYASTGETVNFYAGPGHPALMLIPQQRSWEMEVDHFWLARVLDLSRAIQARGFAPGVSAEVHLQVHDDLLPSVAGSWVVRVRDGRGVAERGGRGEVKIDTRGLAAAFTGFATGHQLKIAGLADGDDAVLATLTSAFGGSGAPSMIDYF